MSHEIRTPMNAILGFSEILKDKIVNPQLAHYLQTIHTSSESLLTLINDTLDISKVEAGKIELEYTPLSIQSLCDEMKILFDLKIRDKGPDFIIDIPYNLPEALLLDEIRIRQVLVNLIGNAVKFTESGYIKISVKFEYLDEKHQNRLKLYLSVEDTGIGIPESKLEDIFNAFYQLKGASQFGGTGLGLTIAKRLTELMNGELFVTSKTGTGSIFSIVIKEVEISTTKKLELNQEQEIQLNLIEFEKSTILIADDIEYNRELIKVYLENYNLNFIEAENGIKVIEQIKKHKPDLILLDMKMPEMDGYETVHILNNDDELKKIPLIAVTASAMTKDEIVISKICDGYLKKPVNKADIVQEIMKFLPHSIKKNKITDISKDKKIPNLSLKVLKSFPELLKILGNENERCKTIAKIMAIDKIENFAQDIQKLAKKFHCQSLEKWGNELNMATSNFQINIVQQMLKDFQDILEI